MAGYDHGVHGTPAVTWDEQQKGADKRNKDPHGAWNATGVEGGAVVSDQFQHDIDRYRKLGHDATQQGPVAVDDRQSNQSRGVQMGALGLLRRQADGSAASSAQILSQRANQNAGSAAANQVTGARGVGSALGAFGSANAAATGQAMAANAHNANTRAGEISHGQNAFTAGGGAIRQGDVQMATQNAQLDAQNRALAEKQQQTFERMAFDTRNTEMTAANEANDTDVRARQQLRASRQAEAAANFQKAKDTASLGFGTLTGIASSDPRSKLRVGSLSSLRRGR